MQPSPSHANPNRYATIRDERDLYRAEYHQAAGQRDRQAEQLDRLGAEVQRLRALLGLAQVSA